MECYCNQLLASQPLKMNSLNWVTWIHAQPFYSHYTGHPVLAGTL